MTVMRCDVPNREEKAIEPAMRRRKLFAGSASQDAP
jgi:hypothetical protein